MINCISLLIKVGEYRSKKRKTTGRERRYCIRLDLLVVPMGKQRRLGLFLKVHFIWAIRTMDDELSSSSSLFRVLDFLRPGYSSQ